MHRRLFTLTLLIASNVFAVTPMKLDINKNEITVSGISAGAQMAHQLHIAYPDIFTGAGMIAGGPFGCAQGSLATAMTSCMGNVNGKLPLTQFIDEIRSASNDGKLGKTSDLADDKVWIFHGTLDTTVDAKLSTATAKLYADFIPPENIRFVNDIDVAHTFPTRDQGNDCTFTGSPFIGNCDYDAAGKLLQFMYGNLQVPAGEQLSGLIEMKLHGADDAGLLELAYLYVPRQCNDSGPSCKAHLVLHGCAQSSAQIGTAFIEQSGYLPWAEANNIVLAFPQVAPSVVNPIACWDWWGYTGPSYRWRDGAQMKILADWMQSL